MTPPNVHPISPIDLLESAGHELSWTLRAAAEWSRQDTAQLAVPGYEVQDFAMDSTFLRARALFEFFMGTGRNYHSVRELDPAGSLGLIESRIYLDHWIGPLHDRVAHLQDRNSNPIVPTRAGRSEHLKSMPVEFADEIRLLWNQMVDALRVERLDPLANRAADLMAEAESAAANVRDNDRSTLYT